MKSNKQKIKKLNTAPPIVPSPRKEPERIAKKEKGKYKVPGHLKDQQLKYDYPQSKGSQLPLFERLEEDTIRDIESTKIEVKEIIEGIKLTPSQQKVIDCLCKLLHDKSQTSEPEKEDYYAGNMETTLIIFAGVETPAPKLAFTLYELTQEYKGGEYVGGKDIENIRSILQELDNKRFLLSYIETTKTAGGRIEKKIELFQKLLDIVKLSKAVFNEEDIEITKEEKTVILLSPIFRRQIDTKFILYPNDITRRTIIAYGSHNLSDTVLRLRDYLMRELSSKRYKPEMRIDKFYYFLNEKWMKESRKKKVKEYADKALETVKDLGLLLEFNIIPGDSGQPKIVFSLNKDFA
jgi:hypothetical protein